MAWLLAGLGNPGPDYKNDRHNLGFMVLDELCRRLGVAASAFRARFGGEVASVDWPGGQRVYLLKPMEFMNVSGQAVQRTCAFYQIEPQNVIVVHDEIDLPMGKLRVKSGGGHGGHNGLRSISQTIGPDYLRVRCGIGKPSGGKEKVTGHVLGGFSKAEQVELPFLLGRAADAVDALLQRGLTFTMNEFNKDPVPT